VIHYSLNLLLDFTSVLLVKENNMADNPVSCHLITWGDHFDQGLSEVEELGFHACEPFPQVALSYENRPAEFRDLLSSHHLRLSALYGGGRFSDVTQRNDLVAYNLRLARFLSSIGVSRLVFGPGGPRTGGGSTKEDLYEAAKTINEAARACYDLGVLACVHPHLGTEIETESEIDTIMDLTDPRYVFFCPDTAHLTAAEINVPQMIRRFGERMCYMHIKDLRSGVIEERRNQNAGVQIQAGTERLPIFCELGHGIIDYGPIMKALQDVDYNDWITVEIDVSLTTPKESLSVCRDYIQMQLGLKV
jgi:inosose dehydratase